MRDQRQILKDSVWIANAIQTARLSKDENTKIGAIIVGSDGKLISAGYNGGARGIPDDHIPHGRDVKELQFYMDGELKSVASNKQPFMVHAERNAIDACARPEELKGATIYVTAMPCPDCAWNITRHGISRVVVAEQGSVDPGSTIGNNSDLTMFMFAEGNVDLWIGDRQVGLVSVERFVKHRKKSKRFHG